MWKKISAALGFIAVIVGGAIGGGFGKLLGNAVFEPSRAETEAKLIEGFNRAAAQSNSQGPRMVDAETRWDKTTVGPGARVNYFYSFPNRNAQDVNLNFATLTSTVRDQVCASKDMRLSLKYGGAYVYSYKSKDGVELARFELSKKNCSWFSPKPDAVLPQLDCVETGEPIVISGGKKLKPVTCK